MTRSRKKPSDLRSRNKRLKEELDEAQETLRAIAQGEVDAFIVHTQDGEQVYTLKSAEHPYRVMVEAMNEGAATLLLDGTIIYSNDQLGEILGRDSSDLAGKSMSQFVAVKDRPVFDAMLAQASLKKTKAEMFLTRPDGSLMVTQVSLASVDLDGALSFSMIVTDLTEQKQNEALIVSEKLTRSILEQAAEAIVVCDEQGLILRANPAAKGLIGRDPLGQRFNSAFRLLSEDGGVFKMRPENHRQEVARGIPVSLVRTDGRSFYLSMSICHLKNSDTGLGFVVTLTDITEAKRVESQLKAAKTSAEEASNLKTAFLANMSHEIRTPLGAIIGFTELLKDPHISPHDEANYIEVISRSGKALTRLIDDILDLSKVEAGKLEVEKVDFSLTELLDEVSAMFSEKARKKNIGIAFQWEGPRTERVKADPTRLRQILVNVVGNAVKFTTMGSINVSIRSGRNEAGENMLRFRVKDTGAGLSPQQRERLFESFSQGDSSTTRKFGGTGLGLVLSRRLARAMGGDVSLEWTAPGSGSIFLITVRADKSDLEVVAAPAAKKDDFGQSPLRGLHLLVVEDSPDNQELIKRFLENKGARVDLASDGEEGVAKALAGHHDLILMDIQMPVLDGYTATAQLRDAGYKRPIIAVTAYAMEEEKSRCLERGCNGHLSKPLNSNLLTHTVLASIKTAKSYRHRLKE